MAANPHPVSTAESRARWGKVWLAADRARPFDTHQPPAERPSLLRRLLGFGL